MLGIADYPAFIFAVIVFLAIPGVGNLAVITSTSQGKIMGGLASTAGLMLGDQVLIWLAVAGMAAVLAANPALFTLVQWCGAVYLAFLGFKMLFAKRGDAPVFKIESGRFFSQSLWITLLNPKAIVFYMAFFPLFVDPAAHRGLPTFALMAVTIALLTFIYCFSLTLIVHFAAEQIRRFPSFTQALNKIAGLMLIGFGLKLVLQK